ncbi:hypothetical protein RostovM3_00023 [Vibrio phage Rostov M3]|uniref:Uncharacterized protein n=1 Tax=Vibrio phage Rostov M3 TaxID=2660724 RepID=A0A5Q2WCA2_9CAUD|nr:hypothetical protein RostovM3_00023 [Vibrio phage Rostov M3]
MHYHWLISTIFIDDIHRFAALPTGCVSVGNFGPTMWAIGWFVHWDTYMLNLPYQFIVI